MLNYFDDFSEWTPTTSTTELTISTTEVTISTTKVITSTTEETTLTSEVITSTTEVTTSTSEVTTATSIAVSEETSLEETTKTTGNGDKSMAFGLYSSNTEFIKIRQLIICFIMIKAMR